VIDFSLTEEQEALQETAREFAEKEMKPNAAKYDKGEEFPEDIMKKAFEVGFLTCTIPKENLATLTLLSSARNWLSDVQECIQP